MWSISCNIENLNTLLSIVSYFFRVGSFEGWVSPPLSFPCIYWWWFWVWFLGDLSPFPSSCKGPTCWSSVASLLPPIYPLVNLSFCHPSTYPSIHTPVNQLPNRWLLSTYCYSVTLLCVLDQKNSLSNLPVIMTTPTFEPDPGESAGALFIPSFSNIH